MPEYRRAFEPGGMFFFTVVTQERRPLFDSKLAVRMLGDAFRAVRQASPFDLRAFVILPDHLHCLWQLPREDADFSTRWSRIKRLFTQSWLARNGGEQTVSRSRARHRERGVWQRRFWEHAIRDDSDMVSHANYIHYNPVKHGLASCPHVWPLSSFSRWVASHHYDADWQCVCDNRRPNAPDFAAIDNTAIE